MKNHPERKTALFSLLLAIVSLGIYARTLTGDFVWDDPFLIKQVDKIYAEGGIGKLFSTEFRLREAETGFYRPLVTISLLADGTVYGPSPVGYHLTNVLLHAACTLILFAVLRGSPVSREKAFLGALVFSVHPVHAESVAFISGRTDLLASVFALLSTAAWVHDHEGGPKRILRVALGSLGYLLALLSKESVLLLPAGILAVDFITRRFVPRAAARGRRPAVPWLVGWAAAFACYGVLRFAVAGSGLRGIGVTKALPWNSDLVPGVLLKLLHYAKIMVVPLDLSALYIADDLQPTLLSLVALALLALLAVSVARRAAPAIPMAAFAWFIVFLLPVLPGTTASPAADRYLYLPSASLCALAGFALGGRGAVRRRWLRHLPAAALVGAFSVLTFLRSGVWSDDLSLFRSIVVSSPGSAHAHGNLGYLLREKGLVREAIAEYTKALALDPNLPRTLFDLGEAHRQLGRWEEAAVSYRRALFLPESGAVDYPLLLYRLGEASSRLGSWGEAVSAFQRALRLDPRSADLHVALGHALSGAGRAEDARAALGTALAINPGHAGALRELDRIKKTLVSTPAGLPASLVGP